MSREQTDDFFTIDQNALDREWLRQPKLYHEYAVQLADARQKLEQQKTAVDVCRAEIDQRVRANPEEHCPNGKATESAIASVIETDPFYKKAVRLMQNARHAVDILVAAVETLDQRKKALENLVQLRLADYFSEPRGPRNSREFVEGETKRRVRRAVADG